MVLASLVFKFEFFSRFCYYRIFPNWFYTEWIKPNKFMYYDTHLSPSYLSLRSQLSHNPATPLREINAEWLKTYLVNIKIKFEHINFPNNSKQGPKIDGFRKSPSKCHLIWKLKLAPPRRRITLRAGRNKLYESPRASGRRVRPEGVRSAL